MQQIFDKIDLNGNGSVDLDEFTQWLSKYNVILINYNERFQIKLKSHHHHRSISQQ
jgi:Ca2+-binding EF-hand superfamily protein